MEFNKWVEAMVALEMKQDTIDYKKEVDILDGAFTYINLETVYFCKG